MYLDNQKAQILIKCHIPQHVFKIYKHSIFQLLDTTGIQIYDAMRIFTEDNPARQFECEQQRKGTAIAFVESM